MILIGGIMNIKFVIDGDSCVFILFLGWVEVFGVLFFCIIFECNWNLFKEVKYFLKLLIIVIFVVFVWFFWGD